MIQNQPIDDLIDRFKRFCEIDLQLSPRTFGTHAHYVRRFLGTQSKDPKALTGEDVRAFLSTLSGKSPCTYGNALSALKVFLRDFLGMGDVVGTFRFPRRPVRIRSVPSKADLRRFYGALTTTRDRALFLMYATTGLRESELLSLECSDIDLKSRMVTPRLRPTKTKNAWVSFFNEEAARALKEYLAEQEDPDPRLFAVPRRSAIKVFERASRRAGVYIRPQVLREWFACEMGRLGVPDRYVDAFCGRVPRSVLARHYTDYSPETLKEIYDRAGLTVLS